MLTQIQIIEPQAIVLAACPRPRAFVLTASSAAAQPFGFGAPIAASARRLSPTVFVRPRGFAGVERSAEVARAERGFGYGSPAALAAAASGTAVEATASAPTGMAGINWQDKQDQQHLTTRRGPVTWRPPH